MKERFWGFSANVRAVVAAEVVGAATTATAVACRAPLWTGIAGGVVLGVLLYVLRVARLTPSRWISIAVQLLWHREKQVEVPEPTDIDSDGDNLGVLIDGHTVVAMIEVWGRPYIPTLLRPQGSETPNTVPVSVIASQMRRFGLGVDIDILAAGRRTQSDNYAQLYATLLADRPAAGQRSTIVVIRLDTRANDTVKGLMWRTDTAAAAAAVARRIVRALRQRGCRAEPMPAADMRAAMATIIGGGQGEASDIYRESWRDLTHKSAHVTSYYFSADDVCADRLNDVWSINTEHTLLALHLRRRGGQITASATARFTTPQPQLTPPALILNRFSGRQWWALQATVPGQNRITGIPEIVVHEDLDTAIAIGSSGVMLGKVDDGLVLMPLRDPAGPTRIIIDADDDMAVRQLIRRAAAAGEIVAVYDAARRWSMTAPSSRIWVTSDLRAQPPRPPTMVVHNGVTNPYPGATTSVCISNNAAASSTEPDIRITQRNGRITLGTTQFTAYLDAVTFRNEATYLN